MYTEDTFLQGIMYYYSKHILINIWHLYYHVLNVVHVVYRSKIWHTAKKEIITTQCSHSHSEYPWKDYACIYTGCLSIIVSQKKIDVDKRRKIYLKIISNNKKNS